MYRLASLPVLVVALFVTSSWTNAADPIDYPPRLTISGLPGQNDFSGVQNYFELQEFNWQFSQMPRWRRSSQQFEMEFGIYGNASRVSLVQAMAAGTIFPEATLAYSEAYKYVARDGGVPEEGDSQIDQFSAANIVYTLTNIQVVGYSIAGSSETFNSQVEDREELIDAGIPRWAIPMGLTKFRIKFETISAQVDPIIGSGIESGSFKLERPRNRKK